MMWKCLRSAGYAAYRFCLANNTNFINIFSDSVPIFNFVDFFLLISCKRLKFLRSHCYQLCSFISSKIVNTQPLSWAAYLSRWPNRIQLANQLFRMLLTNKCAHNMRGLQNLASLLNKRNNSCWLTTAATIKLSASHWREGDRRLYRWVQAAIYAKIWEALIVRSSSSSNRYESSVLYTTATREAAAAAATGVGHSRFFSKQPLTATASAKKPKMVVSEYLVQYKPITNYQSVTAISGLKHAYRSGPREVSYWPPRAAKAAATVTQFN